MLLERDDILAQLQVLAGDAEKGCGRVAFVVGEAGFGKTTVLRAAAQSLSDRLRPLWTACEDLSTVEALTLLRDLAIVQGDALDRANDSGSRLALFGEALGLLCREPTLLLVEDLHWADEGSIDFLRYVGRRIADLPLLVIASSRNEEQGARSRLARAWDLPAALRCRFDLARLSSAAVGRLAAAHGLIGAAIHAATGGNPLMVTEMLSTGGHRPASIDDIVVGRADRLDEAARDFLNFCSIIPRRVSLDQIVASGASDAAIQACLDSALLLADGDGVAFRHEITRHAVEDALSPLRRALLHRRELEWLDARGASAARRLHHAIGADSRERILELAPLAACQAAKLGAHHEAADAWAALLERDGDAQHDPAHCEAYAFELHLTGRIVQAIAWQRRALELHAAAGDELRHGDALRFLSRLHYLNGERTLADRYATQAVATLIPFAESAELALAYANIAHLAMLADDLGTAVRWSERAIPLAEALGRDDILATVLNNYGTALQYENADRGFALLDRSIELGMRTGSDEHVARSWVNKGWMLLQDRRLEEALPVLAGGVEYCRERELDTWRDYMAGGCALALLGLGRWSQAEEAAASVVADPANTPLMRNPAVRAMATLRLRRGEDGWAALVAELRTFMESGREAPRFVSLALIEAEAAWTLGSDAAGAVAILDEAAAMSGAGGSPWDNGALWDWQRRLGTPRSLPERVAQPYRLLAAGDRAGAAAGFAAKGMPFEQALVLADGDAEEAAEGLAILDRLGAAATAARVRLLRGDGGLRRGARGPRASTRSNGFGLTRREIDVLRALDKGWTNKEIGERLFVSAKTVDHHVSSILGKIQARTRGEAAAVARANGLFD